ncbi:unnamed protein product, partial [Ectocarpus sp. 12 AP-2014]
STRQKPHRRNVCSHFLPCPLPPSPPQHTHRRRVGGTTRVRNVALLLSPSTEVPVSVVDAPFSSAGVAGHPAAGFELLRVGLGGGGGVEERIAGNAVLVLLLLLVSSSSWLLLLCIAFA